MITIEHLDEHKKEFKKEFNDVDSFAIIIDVDTDRWVTITFRGFKRGISTVMREYTMYGKTDSLTNKNLTISFAHKEDCFVDIIFSKKGFYYETYKNAYGDNISISNQYGNSCILSEVIFHTADGKKRASHTELCGGTSQMIR